MTRLELVKGETAMDDGPDEVAERAPTEVELVEYEAATVAVPKAVDPPATHLGLAELVGLDLPSRRVIVPRWMKSWKDARQVAWWLGRYCGHVVTYHATRLPVYLVRAIGRAFQGCGRTVALYWRWLWDLEGRQMARAAHQGSDQAAWATARKVWRETVHRRLIGSGVAAAATCGVVAAAYVWAPTWLTATVVVMVVGVLVHLGAPQDKPLVDAVMSRPDQVWRMTSHLVIDALGSLGLAQINAALKADPRGGIAFAEAIQHDGPGWRVVVDLPKGVTATDVIERREALAAGLRRPLGTVWPEGLRGTHPGRLVIYVGDEDMNTARQPPWPLLRSGQADVFRPAAFGTDQRMRPVWTTLAYASFVIGAVPRMGKTFALRLLLLIAALDPRCRLYVHDNKGSGDLSCFEHVAHAYTVGDEDDDLEVALDGLRKLREEMRRRYKVLRSLPKTRAPETNVTPELASDPSLGLFPIVVGVDECQMWFEHKKLGPEFEEIVTDLVKRGPAALIVPLLATQRPDAKSIPRAISDNIVLRFCLKVIDAIANNMVLGSGRYAAGVRATMFAFEDKGIGYYAGEGADARIIKSYYVNSPDAEKVCIRARGMRERLGTLTGYAVGDQEVPEESVTLADDLPRVFVSCERLHSEDIVARLQELRPGTYDGWTVTTLALAVRDQLGLKTGGIKIGGTNKAGLRRGAVLEAVAATIDAPELLQGSETGGSGESS